MENKERRVLDGGGGGGGGGDDIDDAAAAEDVEETTVFLDNKYLEQRKRLEVTAASSSTSPTKRTTNSQKEQQRAMSEKDVSFDGRSHNEARKFTQILAVAAVSFGACIYGTTIVFPAVAGPSLEKSNRTYTLAAEASVADDDNTTSKTYNSSSDNIFFHSYHPDVAPLPFILYPNALAYLASIPAIGTLFGSLFAGPISNWVGRKWTYIIGVCGTLSTGYVLIAFAQAQWMMLLGRFLHGAGVGFSTTIATVYTMEIATPNLRGRLAAAPAVAGTLGILFCQILGAHVNWKVLSVVLASLNIPFLAALIFIPESPVFLITTNQIDRAHKVLRILRGPRWNITAELTDIKNAQDVHKQQDKRSVRPRDFCAVGVLKPFLIALALMFFLQFTGINVILNYTPNIFKLAGSTIDEFLATIIVGVALLMSNTLTIIVADKMPRRLMLLLSAFGISATLIGIGVFMHLKSLEEECINENTSRGNTTLPQPEVTTQVSLSLPQSLAEDCQIYTQNLGWLPMLLAMLYIFFFNLGYGAMIWITMVEILPQHVRSVAASLAGGFACLWSFLTSHTYRYLVELVTGQGVFWFYGCVSFIGLLFIAFFVPETKGKTVVEIQNHFAPSLGKKENGHKMRQDGGDQDEM